MSAFYPNINIIAMSLLETCPNEYDVCVAQTQRLPLVKLVMLCFFLLDMFDKTRSGRIDLFGFSALWDFMQRWKALFQQFDRDRSGCISSTELHQGNVVIRDETVMRARGKQLK